MIKAVIFDIDGTLVDTVDFHAHAWQEAFRHFGHDFPFAKIRTQIGKGGDQLLPAFLSKHEIQERGKDIEKFRDDLFQRKYFPQARAFPMVRELFLHIRARGQTIALASSCKGDELENYKKLARIEDLLDAATTADDADKSKPHPDIFDAVLKRLPGVAPSEAIAVGDTPYDAEAAGKIGVRTVGVLCGGFPEDQLRDAGCIAIYRDPADLLVQYDNSPAAV
jgi:HAD superfamily hydrolase (TIGR01509 family)